MNGESRMSNWNPLPVVVVVVRVQVWAGYLCGGAVNHRVGCHDGVHAEGKEVVQPRAYQRLA